jgi:glutathione S-transferase
MAHSSPDDFGLLDTPEFLAMNPHGQVTVIEDDGVIVQESHAILRYLAAANGISRLPVPPRRFSHTTVAYLASRKGT